MLGDYKKHLDIVVFKIHAEPYAQIEKGFKKYAIPYDPGAISDYYYIIEVHKYASHFIYDIYNKNKRFWCLYKT